MMDVTRGAHGEVVIRVAGAFDAKAADRLTAWLGEVPRAEPLVVDFTQVRACEDVELASVAEDLLAHEHLVVLGLTRHQERMLRYLGVELDRGERRAAAEDALDPVG